MNTPTHLLMAGAALAQPNRPARNWSLILGALLPDALMFVMYGWAKGIQNLPEREIWSQVYYSDGWQMALAISNSVPVFGLCVLIGLWQHWTWLWVLGVAAILHIGFDVPVHHDDGHPPFWPFSDWIYASPLSYWDNRHHSEAVITLEVIIIVISSIYLIRRFRSLWVRTLVLSPLALLITVPLYFRFMFS